MQVNQMLSLESFKPRLKELLRRTDALGLVSEVAWVVAYALASSTRHVKPEDFLMPLLQLLAAAYSQVRILLAHIPEHFPVKPRQWSHVLDPKVL